MKCTNNIPSKRIQKHGFARRVLSILLAISLGCLTGCGNESVQLPYEANAAFMASQADTADGFAKNLSIVNDNVGTAALPLDGITTGALICINDNSVLYAKDVHKSMYPASLTKVLTALVALKYGKQDDVLTASENVTKLESGAQRINLKPGDSMTLDQALRILLMYSANDVAIMIAEHYGGSVEGFAELMNEEARSLGATDSNYVNANGLNDAEHFVSTYDLYLIFQEACKYNLFREIISMPNYSTVYQDKDGKEISFEKQTTNPYLNGNATAPTNVTVLGGKTGTTAAAGHCLILLCNDTAGKEYIAIILQAESGDLLKSGMTDMLSLIQ